MTMTLTSPTEATNATATGPARDRAAADERLADLVAELSARDRAARERAAERRPMLWLAAMTAGAVALANAAVYVAVAPLL